MALDVAHAVIGDGNAAAAGLTDDGLPIFDVLRVQLDFSIAASFVAAQVANNVLVLALSNGRILRIDLNRPQDIDGMVPSYGPAHCYAVVIAADRDAQTSTYPRSRRM